jgi:phage shock protein A
MTIHPNAEHIMRKQLIYWLLGERAGHLLIATWNWLWGMPVEMGGKVAVEVAHESLSSMQNSVRKFTQSVAQISASYERPNDDR